MVDSVNQIHPGYERNLYSWTLVRDAVEGEVAVKSKGSWYLPMPAAMQMADYSSNPTAVKTRGVNWRNMNDPIANRLSALTLDPNYDSNPAYSAYLMRAQFPEIVGFILRGLMGLAMGDSPSIKLPRQMEYLLERATPTGMTLVELFATAVVETLCTGRYTTIANVVEDRIEIVPYTAESLINWKTRRANNSKQTDAQFMVFEEWDSDEESFSHEYTQRWVVARDLGSVFALETHSSDKGDPDSVVVPQFRGRTLPYIPAVTSGSIVNGLKLNPSPLYSIASTALQIYMRSADLGNSEFVSCNPTLVMSGVDKTEAPAALGPTVVLTLPDPQAKVYYTTTDTSALNHVMGHINDLFERSVYFGAQLLDSSKKAAESAETTRLKQASSGATLSSVVVNTAKAIEKQLKIVAEWQGLDPSSIEFEPVTEFMAPALTANEQKAMVDSWIQGAISKFTLLDNFRRAGVLPAGSTVDDEIARIESDPPPAQQTPNPVIEEETDDAA